jgi:hypothetical protein
MTGTIPPDDDGIFISEWVLVAGVVLLAGVLAILSAAIFGLYRSLPPSAQLIFEAVLPPLVGLLETEVKRSRNQIDDAGLAEIKNYLIKQGLLPADIPPPETVDPRWLDDAPKG